VGDESEISSEQIHQSIVDASNPKTIVFAGGGTGGHLFPGIAVATELKDRLPQIRILFIGTERSVEKSILERSGFEHVSLPMVSPRQFLRHPWSTVKSHWSAFRTAKRLLRKEGACAVIGLGGYASAPVLWHAIRMRIPVFLLEQNVIPGRTTRWFAKSSDVVCTSFEETTRYLPRRSPIKCTGNPIRREIAYINGMTQEETQNHCQNSPRETLHNNASAQIEQGQILPSQLLILGGSQGADSLNDAVLRAIEVCRDSFQGWRIVHQSGLRQVDQIRLAYERMGLNAEVEPFLEEMVSYYRSATLVISRAGATTLAELACCGLPMILLPYPHATDNHQLENARSLANRSAAVCVEHKATVDQTASDIVRELNGFLSEPSRLLAFSDAARNCAKPNAVDLVANLIIDRIQDQNGKFIETA